MYESKLTVVATLLCVGCLATVSAQVRYDRTECDEPNAVRYALSSPHAGGTAIRVDADGRVTLLDAISIRTTSTSDVETSATFAGLAGSPKALSEGDDSLYLSPGVLLEISRGLVRQPVLVCDVALTTSTVRMEPPSVLARELYPALWDPERTREVAIREQNFGSYRTGAYGGWKSATRLVLHFGTAEAAARADEPDAIPLIGEACAAVLEGYYLPEDNLLDLAIRRCVSQSAADITIQSLALNRRLCDAISDRLSVLVVGAYIDYGESVVDYHDY